MTHPNRQKTLKDRAACREMLFLVDHAYNMLKSRTSRQEYNLKLNQMKKEDPLHGLPNWMLNLEGLDNLEWRDAVDALWGDDGSRLNMNLADLAVFHQGLIVRWYFTGKDGTIMRKNSDNMTCDNLHKRILAMTGNETYKAVKHFGASAERGPYGSLVDKEVLKALLGKSGATMRNRMLALQPCMNQTCQRYWHTCERREASTNGIETTETSIHSTVVVGTVGSSYMAAATNMEHTKAVAKCADAKLLPQFVKLTEALLHHTERVLQKQVLKYEAEYMIDIKGKIWFTQPRKVVVCNRLKELPQRTSNFHTLGATPFTWDMRLRSFPHVDKNSDGRQSPCKDTVTPPTVKSQLPFSNRGSYVSAGRYRRELAAQAARLPDSERQERILGRPVTARATMTPARPSTARPSTARPHTAEFTQSGFSRQWGNVWRANQEDENGLKLGGLWEDAVEMREAMSWKRPLTARPTKNRLPKARSD